MARVIVIGGGISGLAAAYRLREALPQAEVTVLEAGPRAGGAIQTHTDDGFTWEAGPNGFLDSKPGMLQLCRDLGLGEQLIAASEGSRKNRYLCLGGKLVKLPASPLGLLTTKALSLQGKLALLCEPFRKKPANTPDDESIASFAKRRFGREAADTIIDGLVTGIHGGDPAQLELAAAFPRLAQFENEAGSVYRGVRRAGKKKRADALLKGEPKPGPARMWSFPGGLQVLVEALAASLGANLKLNAPVRRLETAGNRWAVRGDGIASWLADAIVLTAPAHVQADLLGHLDPRFATELNAIPINRIAVVALGYSKNDVPGDLDGFGYIAPQNTRRDVLGVQWCSSIFRGRAPDGQVLWRALCGGVHRGELLDLSDAELIETVHREMQAVMNVKSRPVFARVRRWRRAIPQYVVGHRARIARIEALAAGFPGLVLGGNAYRGVALNDCTEQAHSLILQVQRHLAARHE